MQTGCRMIGCLLKVLNRELPINKVPKSLMWIGIITITKSKAQKARCKIMGGDRRATPFAQLKRIPLSGNHRESPSYQLKVIPQKDFKWCFWKPSKSWVKRSVDYGRNLVIWKVRHQLGKREGGHRLKKAYKVQWFEREGVDKTAGFETAFNGLKFGSVVFNKHVRFIVFLYNAPSVHF